MSDSPIVPATRPSYSLAGFTTLFIAGSLAVIFVRWPYMHADWPDWFYPLFWIFEAGATLFGVGALALPYLPAAWVRRLPTISRNRVLIPREGVGYLLIMVVLFIGSSLTKSNTLLLVFAMMAGPFVVNGWITYTMLKNVRVSRRTPTRAMAGELFSVQVNLTNETPFLSMWMMVAQDQVMFGDFTWQPSLLFTRVPPRTSQAGHYQIRLMQRGRHRFGPVHISSRFPLGLIERGSLFREYSDMLIYPRIGRLSPRWKRQLFGASELIETTQPRTGAFNDEYHHLREYRAGDNPRAIHWRSSARRNTLIVREYQQNREHHLLLLLDLCHAPQSGGDGHRAIEQTLSLAATICCEHRRESRGASLAVVACGREQWRWEARANCAGLETLLDRLAVVEAVRENRFGRALVDATQHLGGHTRVVVVSLRSEADVMAELDGPAANRRQVPALHWLQVTEQRFAELVHFAEEHAPGVRTPSATSPAATPASTTGAR